MKLFLMLVVGGFFAQAAPSQAGCLVKAEATQLVDRYFDAFNQHDVSALVEFYAKGAILEGPEEPKVKTGREAVRKHYEEFFAAIPDVHDKVTNVVVGCEQVAVEFTATGTVPGGGGETFELKIATIFEIQDGLVTRDATYYDAH